MAASSSRRAAQNGSEKTKSTAATGTIHIIDMPKPGKWDWLTQHNNVFLFIPNLIGYTRVILAACSLYFMRWHPKYCTWLYIVSCLLDAFDGMAARRFGQSKFLIDPTFRV
jgi:CDP-alcohol phosphatidyltransferase